VTETETHAAKAKRAPRKPKAPATEAKAGPVVHLLECRKVSAPKADKGLRTFNKEFAENLAASICVEGMYNPIVVRPNPKKHGDYIVVQGKHRLYAKKDVLKEQFIECSLVEMDEAQAEFAMITENLWRNSLTKGQETLSVKKFFEYYKTKYAPEPANTAVAQSDAAPTDSAIVAGSDAAPVADPTAETSTENKGVDVMKKVSGFTDLLAASTSVSKRQADRELRIAKAFDEDQLQVLDQEKVGTLDREMIARVENVSDRGAIVNLIACGMVATEAIASVMKDNAPTPVNAKAKAVASAIQAAVPANNRVVNIVVGPSAKCGVTAEKLMGSTPPEAGGYVYVRFDEFLCLLLGNLETALGQPLRLPQR
jgi:hypothetical protein